MALAVVCAFVAVMVAVYAYTSAPGGETAYTPIQNTGAEPVPPAVLSGGPVVDASEASSGGPQTPARTVVLTFDDGPSRYTRQVLDVLEHYRVPATFFVVGSNIAGNQDVLRRMVADGDEIGVHTFTHPDLAGVSRWRGQLEIDATQFAIASATGYVTDLLRLPYSSRTAAMTPGQWALVRREAGYRVVFADRDTRDWMRPGTGAIVRAAMPTDGSGALVVLHDGGGDRSQTVAALKRIIPALLARGYRFDTVSHSIGAPSPWTSASASERFRGLVILDATLLSRWVVNLLTVLFWIGGGLAALRTVLLVFFARRHVRRVPVPASGAALPPVSVIIPAYNENEGIEACVRSIVASDYPWFEVIVVDDGSTDGTGDIVRSLGLADVRVLEQQNAGKPAALRTGIDAARHDVLVLVDADTVFEPDTISRLAAPLMVDEVGAVAGNTKVGNRRGLLGRWQHIEYVIGFNLDRRLFDELECMPTVPGAVGAFRRTALDSAGGVSGDTLAEDTDLTMSICRAGWRVVYAEKARAWTDAPTDLGALWRQRYRWCYGTLQATWKHRGAVFSRGRAGHLGRRGLSYLFAFHVALPLLTPVLDVAALTGVLTGQAMQLGVAWLAFQALQLLSAVYAFRLDGERMCVLWTLPLQTIVYRQLMYLVVVQSVATALYGIRLSWHHVDPPDRPFRDTRTDRFQVARTPGPT